MIIIAAVVAATGVIKMEWALSTLFILPHNILLLLLGILSLFGIFLAKKKPRVHISPFCVQGYPDDNHNDHHHHFPSSSQSLFIK